MILPCCDRWLDGVGMGPLDQAQRDWWLAQARGLAASGLRLLAFAAAPRHGGPEAGV